MVLWFEHDLFCQANLLYVAAWYRQRRKRSALSLVSRKTLGGVTPEQLAAWYPQRRSLLPAHISMAAEAWDACCAPTVAPLEALLCRRLQFAGLSAALQAHLDRLLTPEDGLDRIERAVLWLITIGFTEFGELFEAFGRAEPVYGLGD
ncbi:MAG: hypothetical protein EXR52_03560, partial [Dehalococcoidia bacterium]|nr:hypothetical protein [Dehalococcoidia bacterium]